MKVSFRQLTHALALANHGSFRDAALALHLTQPALTRSIQALEATLGVVLFDRLPGGVEPTHFGQVLLQKGARVLREAQELERDVAQLLELQTGSLSVAAGPFPGHRLVPLAVARCLGRVPGLQANIRVGDWKDTVQRLLQRECEVAVAERSTADSDQRFGVIGLGPERCCYLVRSQHPLASRQSLGMDEMAQYPFAGCRVPARLASILPSEVPAGVRDAVTGEWLPILYTASVDAALCIAASSDAITALPLTQAEDYLLRGDLVVLDVVVEPIQLDVAFIFLRSRALSPVAEVFLAELQAQAQETAAREQELRQRLGVRP